MWMRGNSEQGLHKEFRVEDDESVHHRHGKDADGGFVFTAVYEEGKKHNIGNQTQASNSSEQRLAFKKIFHEHAEADRACIYFQ